MSSLDQDLLDNLTPEEIAAVQGDDLSDEDRAALERIANGKDDRAAGDDPVPVYQAELPPDFETKVHSLDERERALRDAFRAGEIEFDEMEEQREALIAERSQLNVIRVKADISREMNEQVASKRWVSAVQKLADDAARPENGGIDYRTDAEKAADLDGFIRMLSSNPAHAGRPMDWFLQEAHRRVLALHGSGGDRPARAGSDRRRDPVDDMTLAAAHDDGRRNAGPSSAGEFAHLDRLEGWELEQAIGQMSEYQRERYLRSQ